MAVTAYTAVTLGIPPLWYFGRYITFDLWTRKWGLPPPDYPYDHGFRWTVPWELVMVPATLIACWKWHQIVQGPPYRKASTSTPDPG